MKFTYDQLADALYIQLVQATVAQSKRINFNVTLDFDADGQVIGMEVLNVRKRGLNPYEVLTHIVTPETNNA